MRINMLRREREQAALSTARMLRKSLAWTVVVATLGTVAVLVGYALWASPIGREVVVIWSVVALIAWSFREVARR